MYVVCNVTETETTVPVPVLKIPGPPAQKELLAAWTSTSIRLSVVAIRNEPFLAKLHHVLVRWWKGGRRQGFCR